MTTVKACNCCRVDRAVIFLGSSGFPVKQGRRLHRGGAEDAESEELLVKKFSDLCEFCASVVNTSSQKTRNNRLQHRSIGDADQVKNAGFVDSDLLSGGFNIS